MRVAEQLRYLAELHGMGPSAARSATRAWLERFGLAERAGDELQKLSLGNQRRVQLAAALVFGPDLLVLDEPFAGLDPVAVDVMSVVLREQADAALPVVFSSHELDLAERLCDRVGSSSGVTSSPSGRCVSCAVTGGGSRKGPDRSGPPAPGCPVARGPLLSDCSAARRRRTLRRQLSR
jgi:ABC-2 type transport system ATP-binding protein